MKRLLWFFSDRAGCGAYRVQFPAYYLSAQQYADCEFVEQREFLLKDGVRGMREDDFAFDAMVFQRAIGEPWVKLMRMCRDRGVATVVELDDDLFNIPRTNPAAEFWGRRDVQRALFEQLDLADRVLVSTRPLADRVLAETGWTSRDKLSICHNHLQPIVWSPEALSEVVPYRNEGVVIGWQGSQTHETDFTVAADALVQIIDRYPQVMLRFFGFLPKIIRDRVPAARRQVVKGVPFESYPATLRFLAFDIGIAPLTPCWFNESKSNIKWLEYAALKVPCVASAVYPYAKSIDHGRTGFLAKTSVEWFDALSALVEQPVLRQTVAEAAWASVWAQHSAAVHGPSWVRAFDQLPVRARVSA